MKTEFTWKVLKLDCYPNKDNYTNVVFNVLWNCFGNRIDNNVAYNDSFMSNTELSLNDSTPFTPYENLTEEQILNWIWGNGNFKSEIENLVDNKINNQINPTVIFPPLPFAPTKEQLLAELQALTAKIEAL